MSISTKIRTSATTLTIAAGLLAPIAAASSDNIVLRRDGSKAVPFERNLNPTATARGDDIVLRRDGSKAVPFKRNLNPTATASGHDIVLRRDGSKAVPFEPNLNPTETSANATEGFDWGDAGLGTGALVVVLGAAGARSLRGRRVAPMPSRRADDAL
jgi:hypothetical protein